VPACQNPMAKITPVVPELHDAAWWAAKTKGFDFSDADRIDANAFNHILWEGTMGDEVPYPTSRSRQDLRLNRAQLIKQWHNSKTQVKQAPDNTPGGQ
jgi:hypothetical protein